MLLIRGGTLVGARRGTERASAFRGEVLVDGETIAAVGPPDTIEAPGAEVLDASGTLVIPGGIDPHTHLDLPVGAVRSADDFVTGTIAAACGGTTCLIDFAGAGREPAEEALETWHAKAAGAVLDYAFHLTVTSVPEDPEAARRRFEWFVEQGVTSVKLYMAYPERLMVDDATLGRALRAAREAGVLVCVHAEDGLEVERRTARTLRSGETGPRGLIHARPPAVEAAAVARAAGLARAANADLYVVHLSSADGLRAAEAARRGGARVVVETCPHYLFLTDERLRQPDDLAQDFVCVPPLRGDDDRAALWAGLEKGSVDTVGTDHCPFTPQDRRRGTAPDHEGWRDFTEIPGGLPGLEVRLPLLYRGVRDGIISPERWVDLVAGAPARLFGLAHRKGAIAPGLDADLVVFDPEATRRLSAEGLHMSTSHSPYAGFEARGWPALVLSRGRAVARAGEPADPERGWGRFVPRRPFRASAAAG